jgi:hypothetical protein
VEYGIAAVSLPASCMNGPIVATNTSPLTTLPAVAVAVRAALPGGPPGDPAVSPFASSRIRDIVWYMGSDEREAGEVGGQGREGGGGDGREGGGGDGREGGGGLPLLPGFREMALRRMAEERRRLVTDLTAERQAARLSQTVVAARMGTSQSAVARLESGEADTRASTLERYAAAIGRQLTWRLGDPARREDES